MDLSEITYHSRRRDGCSENYKQDQHERQPLISIHNNANILMQIETKYLLEIQRQKQKIKTLSYQLRQSITANNKLQEQFNQIKKKNQDKYHNNLQQFSILKANSIIKNIQNNDLKQENAVIKDQNQRMNSQNAWINEYNSKISKQNQRIKEQNHRKTQVIKQVQEKLKQTQQKVDRLSQKISKLKQNQINMTFQIQKDQQIIIQCKQLIKELKNKESTSVNSMQKINMKFQLSQKQHCRISVQNNELKSYTSQLKQQIVQLKNQIIELNTLMMEQMQQIQKYKQNLQAKQHRILQLNAHVKEICGNSEHLFEEIKQTKLKNQILSTKLRQMDQENQLLEGKLKSYTDQFATYRVSSQSKFIDLAQKYYQLQEQNLSIQKVNTSYVHQNEEMLYKLKAIDDKVYSISQQNYGRKNSQMDIKIQKSSMQKSVLPTQRRDNTKLNSTRCQDCDGHSLREHSKSQRSSFMHDIKEKDIVHNNLAGYAQYLSFKPSHSRSSSNFDYEPKRIYSSVNTEQNNKLKNQRLKTQNFNDYRLNKKSKSLYFQNIHNNSYENQQSITYKSLSGQNYPRLENERGQVNDYSVQLRGSSASKDKQHEKRVNQNCPDKNLNIPEQNKSLLIERLERMGSWSKQWKGRDLKERRALEVLGVENDGSLNLLQNQNRLLLKGKNQLQKKNIYNLNLNSQIMHRKMLRLQNHCYFNNQGIKSSNQCLGLVVPLTQIPEKQKQKQNRINDQTYRNCKKVVYG